VGQTVSDARDLVTFQATINAIKQTIINVLGDTKMKIGIVGTGMVGATAAYAMVMRGVGREIILVDLDKKRTRAEADDINHAVPFANPIQVKSGEYADLVGCKVVVVAAGVGQKPGETRLELLGRNAAVFQQVIPAILEHAPRAILVIATNPVDIMTHLAARYAAQEGVTSTRVIGSGTTLDTARFRSLLGQYLGVDSYHVHGYVVGEHGDSEVLLWSLVNVGGVPLKDFCKARQIVLDDAIKQQIDNKVRRAAYNIIEGKGATYYGIGSALAAIVKVILQNERSVLTICSPAAEIAGVENVTVAMPLLFGGDGVIETLPLPLEGKELEQLQRSATIVKQAIDSLDEATKDSEA
jgi:L-lactate dehydrogenase